MKKPLVLSLFLAAPLWPACATSPRIPGTKVEDTQLNRELVEVCERYRHALEDRDAQTLVELASPNYFEDSGTPKAEDDYGYDGLKAVINSRLLALKSVRYSIQYREVLTKQQQRPQKGSHAAVDIRYDASFQLATDLGDRWERKQNEKRLELEYDGNKWLFVSGM